MDMHRRQRQSTANPVALLRKLFSPRVIHMCSRVSQLLFEFRGIQSPTLRTGYLGVHDGRRRSAHLIGGKRLWITVWLVARHACLNYRYPKAHGVWSVHSILCLPIE